jgi:hypothetical protein
MTSDRAKAYGRVVKTLEDKGSSKLAPLECDRIREAADIVFFAERPSEDSELAVTDVRVLAEHLIEADRWEEWQAQQLIDDLAGCGPVAEPVA